MTEPTVEHITANGVDFAYLDAGEGPLVLCLHGYPDTPYSYDALSARLVAEGYRVVAPFMRGYAPTGLAPDGQYGGLTLGEDVIALLDALGAPTARLVGHDWGAFAVYLACNMAPARFEQAVTLAIAHPRALGFDPRLFIKAWHFLFYQLPWLPEWWLSRRDFAAIDAIWRRWSPTTDFPPEETAAVKAVFREPGALKAALGYYRALRLNPWGQRFRSLDAVLRQRTSVDTLALYGLDDGVLRPEFFEKSVTSFTGPYRYEGLPACGHFLLRERPAEVIDRIAAYFGPAAGASGR